MERPTEKHPISAVKWVPRGQLEPNDFNPNNVAAPELRLLAISIWEDGWTQPIVRLPTNVIVDGFHRWKVSEEGVEFEHQDQTISVYEITDGLVPVATIDADRTHHQMSCVRHNRARGKHGVLAMADIVQGMIEDGVPVQEIQERLGMEDEEVKRLASQKGMPLKHSEHEFSQAWKPDPDA